MCAGANVQKGKSLDSPLHAAAEKDSTEVVKLLLDFGADINARNTEFQRPVDVAPPSSLTEGFLLLYEGSNIFFYVQPLFLQKSIPKASIFGHTQSLPALTLSNFYSYSTTAQPAVSPVHQELCWPGQAPSSGPSTPAKQAQELPAVSLKAGKLELMACRLRPNRN